MSLASSSVVGNYDDSPSKVLHIFTFFPRGQLSFPLIALLRTSSNSSLSFAAELTKWTSLFSKNSITKDQRDTLPRILWPGVFCSPFQSIYFLLLDVINTNVLFCHSCSQLSRIFLAHWVSVSNTTFFNWISTSILLIYFLPFYVWRHFSSISVFSSVLENPVNCELLILNE